MTEIIRKSGPFSSEDHEKIKLCIQNGWNDQDIADKIGRNLETVIKYIYKNNMRHAGNGVEPDDAARLLEALRTRSYYKSITKMYDGEDLNTFETSWIEIMKQFNEDVKPIEESAVKRLIHVQIMINHNRIKQGQASKQVDFLKQQLTQESAAPLEIRNTDRIFDLTSQIDVANSTLQSYTTEFLKLSSEEKSITQELKGNRDARIKKVEDSKTTFTGYIRTLEHLNNQRIAGRDAELMRKAMEKATRRLGNYHQYVDQKLDRPLLTSDTINADYSNEEVNNNNNNTDSTYTNNLEEETNDGEDEEDEGQ